AFFPDPEPDTEVGPPVLTVTAGGNEQLDGIDLELRAGEILGISGLQGSGRTELLEAIFGTQAFTRGRMSLDGRPVEIASARDGVRRGLALVTADRQGTGLALSQASLDHALPAIRPVLPARPRRPPRRPAPPAPPAPPRRTRTEVPGILTSLEVISRGRGQEVRSLSGGNQQKVVLAKWLATSPRVVLLDEPTRGIDVGAKIAVY